MSRGLSFLISFFVLGKMFQVPGVLRILNLGGHHQNKIKGIPMLMRKNVLDFNIVVDLTKENVGSRDDKKICEHRYPRVKSAAGSYYPQIFTIHG